MVLKKGWIVLTKDRQVITEEDLPWNKLDKRLISELRLKWYEKVWKISGKAGDKYVQFKSATQALGDKEPTILSRCIGYKEDDGSTVLVRVDEISGNARWEVKEPKGV